ncbi:exodeoxyribonuclease VII large subunit, partial [Endobacter medicaginis]
LRERRAVLDGLGARLESASYEAVLGRGYALVRDAAGHAVGSAAGLRVGERLELVFADGARDVQVLGKTAQGELGL